MDFKQAIIENAWGGFSVDYGLLHLQLATPFAVLIVLFIMIYALNKLLFQPVLRTLDNRTDAIAKSEQTVIQVSEEVESLKQDFQKKLDAVRMEALHLRNTGHEEGLAERESMILEERKTLENEIEKNIAELEGEIKSTKKKFSKLNKELSVSIRKQLIN
jgi:F-type H+-transporting ATPase subunit b|tara:strand:- start:167 stop:646 length:480 start_codon:yes stop_codon:yes gene_type:complete